MTERKDFAEIVKLIYIFLKNTPMKEYSINTIAKRIKTRWDTTAKALELLKSLNLVKERKTGSQKTSSRLFKCKSFK